MLWVHDALYRWKGERWAYVGRLLHCAQYGTWEVYAGSSYTDTFFSRAAAQQYLEAYGHVT